MFVRIEVTEKNDGSKDSHKMVSYKNNVELFKLVETTKKTKKTTLLYYVKTNIDITKLL